MASFRKAILKVGTYQSPDGEVQVTPERLQHWAKTFDTMRSRQLGIPAGWDHSDDPEQTVPVDFSTGRGRRSAKDVAGTLKAFHVSEDGNSAEIELELGDSAAEKARDNFLGVSPIIYPKWRDGRGREYDDAITHIDLVTHPVDDSQGEFVEVSGEELPIAAGIRMSLDGGKFAMYRMGDEPPTEKPEDGGGTTEENPDLPDYGKPGEDEKQFEAIIAHLEQKGIVLPSDTDKTNFFDRLLTALMTANRAEQDAEAEKAKEKDDQEEDDPVTVAQPNEVTAMGQRLDALEQENKRLLQRQAESDTATTRMGLLNRLDNALKEGRVTPAQYDKLKSNAKAVKMGLDGEGRSDLDKLTGAIEAIEANPPNSIIPLGMGLHVEDPPEGLVGEMTDEQADEAVDRLFGATPEKKALA